MWNDYVMEEDWDFGFVEVSEDGGQTWNEQVVRTEVGDAVVSTPADYPDPFGRMADYGGKKFGLTGSSGGWRHDYVDLTAVRRARPSSCVCATPPTLPSRSAAGSPTTSPSPTAPPPSWTDDVEGGANGWTAHKGTFVLTSPPAGGWAIVDGSVQRAQFYLAEWRNFDGFDEGLKYTYDTTYSNFGPWKVEKVAYNAPGMLVWIRDAAYGDVNHVRLNLLDSPSFGPKGGLLLVDSHYNPLRRTGEAAAKDPTATDNIPSRPQSSDIAFGLQKTYPFTECLAEVPMPTGARSTARRSAPSSRCRRSPTPRATTRASSACRAVQLGYPARQVHRRLGRRPAATRVELHRAHGPPGRNAGTGVLRADLQRVRRWVTGNPTDPWGVQFSILKAGQGNTYALVRVNPAD